MSACACMYPGCALAGFCIAQNPGRPIPELSLPVYWQDHPPEAPAGAVWDEKGKWFDPATNTLWYRDAVSFYGNR